MSLIHRVGAGLLLLGGAMPTVALAACPNGDCGGIGIPVPAIDNGLGPAPHRWGPRMKYRSAPAGFAPMNPGMVGPMPLMGSGMADCQCGPMAGPMFPRRSPFLNFGALNCGPICPSAPMMNCAPLCSQAPMIDCAPAPAPIIMPQTIMQPVIETQMCPQPVTTYCDVPKTVMRREAIQVQVPSTTYKQVTVDEGGYQQVWVPRMVTKTIPQTVMTSQTQYRDVATTVTERVPRTTTQWVPKQVVRHVPQSVSSNYCGPTGSSSYPTITPTEVTPVPEVYNPTPLHPVPVPMGDSASAPATPPQTSQVQEWQKVRQRPIEQQNYEFTSPDAGMRVPRAAGRFSSTKR